MLYFKKSIKWIKDCFSLVGVVSFFAGVYSLALVDLFYFPEEITPAAFSAAFAGGALMLACYTTWKVKKWLKNKVDETAFKRTEDFLVNISHQKTQVEILRIRINLLLMKHTKESYKKTLDEMLLIEKETFKLSADSQIKLSILNSWGAVFKQQKAYNAASKKLISSLAYIEGFFINETSENIFMDEEATKEIKAIMSNLFSVAIVFEAIENKKFEDKIRFTSPLKKATE